MKIAESGVLLKLAVNRGLRHVAKQAAAMLLLLIALPFTAHAAVAQLGTAVTYYGPGPTAATLPNFVVAAGTNRLLVVTASNTAYQNTSAVNYGATPMTKVVEKNDGGFASDSIWVLPLGTGVALSASNISATFINNLTPSNLAIEAYLSAVVFSGVDQATPISSPVSINNPSGTNLPSALTVTSASGDLVYDVLDSYALSAVTNTPALGQTVIASNGGAVTGGGFSGYMNSTKPGAGSVVMSWTSNATANIQAAINIRQAVPTPDLTVTKTVVSTNPILRGGQVTFRLQVSNTGSGPTSGSWTLTDNAPTGLTFVTLSGSLTTCTGNTTAITCTQSTVIPAGGNLTVDLLCNIAPNAPASITNTASVIGGGETNTTNNAGTATINPVDPADLTVTKVAVGTFQQGGSASYNVTVTNSGTGATTIPYTITDTMPSGLTAGLVTSADPGWNCTASTSTVVSCTRSNALAPTASTTLNIPVTIASNTGTSVTNTAFVTGGGEIVTNNNAGSAVTGVTQLAPDLTVTKVAQGGPFQQGGTVTYLITVTNGGNGPTTGTISMSDTIPTGLIVTSVSGDASWTCVNAQPVTCSRTTALAAGANSVITLSANITSNAPASITNTATVATAGESNSGNNANSSLISVTTITGVTINVPAGVTYTFNGQTVTGSQTFDVAPGIYVLSTTTPQSLGAGIRAVFNNWSDAGAISHTLVVGASAITITGNFTTQYQLTTAAAPANGGNVTPASGTFFDAGTVVNVSATPNAGFVFGGWTGPVASASSAATTVTMDAAKSITANFTAQTNVTVTVPAGISYSFNGQSVTGSQTFQVAPGTYTLSTTTPQSLGAGVRAVFSSWSDAGAISHSVTVGSSALNITGNFTTQYQLTTAAAPANGGTVTPASGTFFDSGTVVNISATPNAGFVFGSWTGPVASASAAATTVTMDAAKTVTANFTAQTNVTVTVPAGISYTFNSQSGTGTQTFAVVPGTYTLATTTPQTLGAGARAVFANWSDAGAISHSVTVGATALTIIGTFTSQYQLTTAAAPAIGGTVTPASGTFYDTGTVVSISATPNAGFAFANWTGPVATASAAATTVTMDAVKSVTANFTPVRTFSGTTATGSGTASVVMTTLDGGATCGLTSAAWVPITVVPQPAPTALLFPHGLFDFRVDNCAKGSTVTFTITYPPTTTPLAAYWKFGPTASNTTAHWYNIPSTITGDTVTFSITDGGLGDDDMNADGTIIDQGGPVTLVPPIPTPTVNVWLLALMMLSLFGYGLRRAARQRVR